MLPNNFKNMDNLNLKMDNLKYGQFIQQFFFFKELTKYKNDYE